MSIDRFDYYAYEVAAHAEFEAADRALGEIDENPDFDFCATCPYYKGFTEEERTEAKLSYGGLMLSSSLGAVVSARLVAPTGKSSVELLLGNRPGNIYTGRIAQKLNSDAAKRTHECDKPARASGLLGILGVKKCQAVTKLR